MCWAEPKPDFSATRSRSSRVVHRRAARVLAEQPRQVAGAGVRLVRQRLRGPRRGGVAHDGVLHAVHTRMHMAAVLQPRRQRGIRAGAALIDHHVARHLAGDARPAVARHHVQRQVDAGRDAGAADQVAVLDEDPVVVHAGGRVDVRQLRQAGVVGGAVALPA
ncbi:hypothetical protein G6F35_015247 [Rhizopus arrhizus]|nr:hypothetical protein G6F35_015247 [Rhizopus arrhizus]